MPENDLGDCFVIMIYTIHPVIMIALIGVIFAIIATTIAIAAKMPLKPTRTGATLSVLPSLLMLFFCYSLAIHAYLFLGRWPTAADENGFSSLLTVHFDIAATYFGSLLLLSICIWPVALLMCVIRERWRVMISYLCIHGAAYLISWGLLLLAPAQFLTWWWD